MRSPFHRAFPGVNVEVTMQVDKRVAIGHEPAFVYFRIPKAANSTVISTLYANVSSDGDLEASAAKRAFTRASNLNRRELERLSRDHFLFTFVRDPFSRLASAYLDKVVAARGTMAGKRAVAAYLGVPVDAEISFLDFCRFLNAGGLYSNPHWYPQGDFIPCGVHRLDFVGRVERLEKDLPALTHKLFGASAQGVIEWAPHRTSANDKLVQLYCAESIDIVRRIYNADFHLFGYSREPAWINKLTSVCIS